ncbi:guanine-1-methyltransferase-domain-containing protein [Russula dissimulans]|nr:guanine-1-methyltransferase-domain-containing protein [Russula dissimulans]
MARLEERKLERRAKEKAAKKEKKRRRAERIATGEQLSEDERTEKRAKLSRAKEPFAARVVLDLAFDDKMSDKEITSLCSQLAYVYSANRHSSNPFRSLLFTSLNGRTLARLEKLNDGGYKRWTGTEWWTEGYDNLWAQTSGQSDLGDSDRPRETAGEEDRTKDNEDSNKQEKLLATPVSRDCVVYLTADSSDVLEELKEGETYIIGGICDHNRYKNLCLDKAKESGVRAAQLPIGRYLSHLATRKVLTVNQVFEILVKWVETRDWEQSLYAVIPRRKFQDSVGHEGPEGKSEDNTAVEGAA